MSALGSSVINKSGKKFAPKAPVRRPAASTSAQTSARPRIDRQISSQTPQPQPERQPVSTSPAPSVSHPTPAPSQQPTTTTQTSTSQADAPTLISVPTTRKHTTTRISIPTSRKSQPANLQAATEKALTPRKHTAEPPSATSKQAPLSESTTTHHTPVSETPTGVEATGAFVQENSIVPIIHPSLPPNTASTSVAGSTPGVTTRPNTDVLQDNANPPVAKRRRIEKRKNSTTQVVTPNVRPDVTSSTPQTNAVVAEPSGIAGRGPAPTQTTTQPAKPKKPRVPAKPRGKKRTDDSAAPNVADETQTTSGSANAGSQPPKAKRPRTPAQRKGKQTAEEAAAEVVTDAVEGTAAKKKAVHGRRKRSPTPEEAANETITPTEIKMAELCKDLRKGKKSKLYRDIQAMEEAEEAKKKQKELQDQAATETPEAPDSTPQETVDQRLERIHREKNPIQAAPELMIVDGQITFDQNTLQIDRHANAAIERNREQLESVEENVLSRRVNQNNYLKIDRCGSWNEMLTDQFYDALRMFGTDFEMISKLFPGRTRRSIKLKFCKEEKIDYPRIKEALMGERIPVDIDEFSKITNTVFDDPKELEREMEEDRRALELNMAKEKEVMQEAVRKRAEEARLEGEAVGGGEGTVEERRGKGKKGKGEKKRKGKRGKVLDGGGEVELGPIEE